jgi:hypothetical protein
VQFSEELIVIEHPMKSRGAHNDVERAPEWQMKEIAANQMQPRTELRREVLARGMQHVLGEIDADNAPARQGFEQIRSQSARSTTGIQDDFISTKVQPLQNFLAPTDLRSGQAVVDVGVPLAGWLGFLTHRFFGPRIFTGYSRIFLFNVA